MTPEFNTNIAFLSYGVTFIGVYVAISAAEQFRGTFLKYRHPTLTQKLPWLILNGIGVGIISFWGMHSLSMSGVTIRDDMGNIVPIKFNIGISLCSILFGFVCQVIGILIACGDRFYAKSKEEILEFFVQSRSIEEILSYSESYVTYLLISKELTHSAIGGIFACVGLIGVIFLGMAAVEFPGFITYNGGIIFASLMMGFPSAIFAYWLFFRLLSIFPNLEIIRIVVPFVGAVAICGIQYLVLFGSDFHVDYSRPVGSSWKTGSIDQEDSLYLVLLVVIVTLWAMSISIFTDLRMKSNAYRAYIQKLSPSEKLSDLLIKVENSVDSSEVSASNDRRKQGHTTAKRGKVAPSDEEESVL